MKRKFLAGVLAMAIAVNPVLTALSPTAYAQTPEHQVTVKQENGKVIIGNDLIEREFDTAGDKLQTTRIVNKRTDGKATAFVPAEGSEEFVVRVTKGPQDTETLHPALNRNGWTAKADSRQNASGASDGPAQNLLDGNVDSIWHTNYGGGVGPQRYPYNVIIDMKKDVEFQCFSYTPRQQGEATNGNILGYELWASNKEGTLEANDSSWKKIASGDFPYNDVAPIYVNLEQPQRARQLKLVAKSAKNGAQFAGGAEFNLHAEPYTAPKAEREFKASNLTLQGEPVVKETSVTLNGQQKHGQKVTFQFAPFTFRDVTYTISENVVMYDGDHFMRKFLEISVPEADREKAAIDFIDLESLKVNSSDNTWTIPTGHGGIVEMEEFKANLGQPIYVQGMFFGCEFPAADTQIENDTGRMRYYTGKTFKQFAQDNQLTQDGKYVTWQTVAGAARSTDMQVQQADFFEYIKSIATPSDFRLQYNSWFDNMMLIDDQSIWKSFIEVDRELNKAETRPLDSYVADDGWNNYNDTETPVDAKRSGVGKNKSGFWEFNSKFPNEFTPASELVENFGSRFGTWVGPRGGYNFQSHLANILTESGKGSGAGGSVDVADRVYVKNFQNMAFKFQEKFGINYWKWDGFADVGQYNQFPAKDGVPGYAHHHMTGGYHHMYHVTDLWEAWIDLMEAVRANAKENNIPNLWISLTCYTNPSPWFLQWANSVWIQCTADQRNASFGTSHLDKQMTYRDACYYDFIKNHAFQFPLSNLYNHDPVYGVEGTNMNANTATDENFKNYLYMMSTRGNAFWELHYSDKIMTDGKYEVTSEFTAWAQENYHMLKNSKMIGGKPDSTHLNDFASDENQAEAYGYSCFDGMDGIISMRNPSATQDKTITFTFDRTMGVAENAGTLQYHLEHHYNMPEGTETTGTLDYGKQYSLTLKPNEVRILRVSKNGDTSAPEIKRAYTDGKNTVTVKFNEKVTGNDIQVEGKNATVTKSADGITYKLQLAEPLTYGETLNITANGIRDLAGNALNSNTISTVYYKDNLAVQSAKAPVTGEKNLGSVDLSDDGFTLNTFVTSAQGAVLKHGAQAELGVQADGKVYFKLGNVTAVSKNTVNDGAEHMITGVKENNGIIKVYVDGALSGSAYDANNRYLALNTADVVLGNASLNGEVAASVYAEGLGYDAVQKLTVPHDGKAPLDTADMTVEVSGTSEGNTDGIFDGDATTYWTSEKAEAGIAKGNPYLIVNLGKEYRLHGVDYTKRYADQPNAYWKCTGNLRDYVLEVSNDKTNWTPVSEGATFADEDLNEAGNGGTTEIRFDPTLAKYIRISGTSSYHWQEENQNKFITVGDLKLYGEEVVCENIALNKTGLTAKYLDGTDAAKGGDRPLSMAVDGTKDDTVGNYAEFGADGNQQGSYLQLDLEKLYDLTAVNLYRYWDDSRTYQNTVVAVTETEDFANPVILYNTDTANKHGLGAGTDEPYAESAEGHSFAVPKDTKAQYVRIYMDGTTAGGRTNHIVELEVFGTEHSEQPTPDVVDTTALTERIQALKAVSKDGKTTSSVKAFDAVVAEAEAKLNAGFAVQDEVNVVLAQLENAEALLVDCGNTDALSALVARYESVQSADYTAASFVRFQAALDAAKAIVADASDASQEQVDAAQTALTQAFENLVKAEPEPTDQPKPTEKPTPTENPEPTAKPDETAKPTAKPTEKPSVTEAPATTKPAQPSATPTGDQSHLFTWIVLAAVCGGSALVLYQARRKNRGTNA